MRNNGTIETNGTIELSPRMEEILALIGGRGMTYAEAADEIGISEHTVRSYVEEIARRIGSELKPRDAMVRLWFMREAS